MPIHKRSVIIFWFFPHEKVIKIFSFGASSGPVWSIGCCVIFTQRHNCFSPTVLAAPSPWARRVKTTTIMLDRVIWKLCQMTLLKFRSKSTLKIVTAISKWLMWGHARSTARTGGRWHLKASSQVVWVAQCARLGWATMEGGADTGNPWHVKRQVLTSATLQVSLLMDFSTLQTDGDIHDGKCHRRASSAFQRRICSERLLCSPHSSG